MGYVKFGIVALLSLALKSDAQEVTYMMLKEGIGGTTICDSHNKPVIVITWKYHGDSSYAQDQIIAHEKVHAQQAEAYPGGCYAIIDRILKDRPFLAELEFHAYCEDGRRYVAHGDAGPTEVAILLARGMIQMYWKSASWDSVFSRSQGCIQNGYHSPP